MKKNRNINEVSINNVIKINVKLYNCIFIIFKNIYINKRFLVNNLFTFTSNLTRLKLYLCNLKLKVKQVFEIILKVIQQFFIK